MRCGDILGTVGAGQGETRGVSHTAVRSAGGTWCIILDPTAGQDLSYSVSVWLTFFVCVNWA